MKICEEALSGVERRAARVVVNAALAMHHQRALIMVVAIMNESISERLKKEGIPDANDMIGPASWYSVTLPSVMMHHLSGPS
jgi:hypothetical protein